MEGEWKRERYGIRFKCKRREPYLQRAIVKNGRDKRDRCER